MVYRIFFLFFIRVWFVLGEDKSVIQSGQPTHFHMEDRGPEIQVTADNEGVKINAKPAGLNVVAKPGKIPSTIPDTTLVSTLEDVAGTSAYHGHLHRILEPVNLNPQLVQHAVEPVMYSAGVNGMAYRGDPDFHHVDTNLGINPSIYPQPSQFHNDWSNGNLGPQLIPQAYNGAAFPMQLPSDYVNYLGWKAGLMNDGYSRSFPAHHHHPYHHHHGGGHHGRHRMFSNFYFPHHHYDDDDDDDDYDDDYDDY